MLVMLAAGWNTMVRSRHLVSVTGGTGRGIAVGNGILDIQLRCRTDTVIGMTVVTGVSGTIFSAVKVMLYQNSLPGTQSKGGAVDVVIIRVAVSAALLRGLGCVKRGIVTYVITRTIVVGMIGEVGAMTGGTVAAHAKGFSLCYAEQSSIDIMAARAIVMHLRIIGINQGRAGMAVDTRGAGGGNKAAVINRAWMNNIKCFRMAGCAVPRGGDAGGSAAQGTIRTAVTAYTCIMDFRIKGINQRRRIVVTAGA